MLVALFGLSTLAGCGGGDEAGEVLLGGTVTINGQPLPSGMAVFTPIGDEPQGRVSVPISQGTLHPPQQAKLTEGRYGVRIVPQVVEFEQFASIAKNGQKSPFPAVRIPHRYTRGTPFEVTLQSGEVNTISLAMTSNSRWRGRYQASTF